MSYHWEIDTGIIDEGQDTNRILVRTTNIYDTQFLLTLTVSDEYTTTVQTFRGYHTRSNLDYGLLYPRTNLYPRLILFPGKL